MNYANSCKASVENGSLFSDSDTEAPRMMKKAKKEKKATKGTKQKHKGKTKESSDEEVEVVDEMAVIDWHYFHCVQTSIMQWPAAFQWGSEGGLSYLRTLGHA